MGRIKIKVEKRARRYFAYPVGLEDKLVGEGRTRDEALADVVCALEVYMENTLEEPSEQYPEHIVAVMGIVRNSADEILLVKSPRRGWEPPGGQVENGEDALTALRREILEESGVEVETGKLLAMYSNVTSDPTKLMLTFEATAIGGRLLTSEESLDVGWFPPEDAVAKVTHPVQKSKFQDALLSNSGIVYRVYGTNPYKLLKTVVI